MNAAPRQDAYDIVVIGAGPAGMAAATMAARSGLSTLVIDENHRPGGQIWRAIGASPVTQRNLLGDDYWSGETMLHEVQASGAEILSSATVWSLDKSLELGVSVGGTATFITGRRVIIATGALERPFPISGWTLPGVMTAGAAQTMLKSSGLLPNGQVLLGGQGPLLWLLAAQILRSGGVISRILDTNDRTNWRAALPHALSFLGSAYFTKGLRLMREVKARVPVVSGVTDLIASGDQQLRSVSYTVAGQRQSVAADVLLLHQGVVPNVNLAMAAGVEHRWDETQLCWVPVLTANGDTSVDGIAIAGDGGGINGALAAIALGKIAGRAAVEAISAEAAAPLPPMAQLQAECGRAMRGRSFLDRLFRPSPKFRIPTGDTIVCRCEEVTAAEILEAINIGATGPNQLKAYRRTGMGPCQGRMCGLTVTELMGKTRDKSPSEIGYFRIRAPVKPITLAELAALPKDENAIKAVERG